MQRLRRRLQVYPALLITTLRGLMGNSKFICKKCGQGDCVLVVLDYATLPTDCPYAMYRPEWLFYDEPPNKVVEDGQAKECAFYGWCTFAGLSGCGVECEKYTPAT